MEINKLIVALLFSLPVAGFGELLFEEKFEDADFAGRGWYDTKGAGLSKTEHIPGSVSSLEFKFLKGARIPAGGTPARHLFKESDSVYVSFWIKFSANWTGSNKPYHPHMFHFTTNKNDKYCGPAWTHLTTYIEDTEGTPRLSIQDGQNIDVSRLKEDLTKKTENRAVAGGNGNSDGTGKLDCYKAGKRYANGKTWDADKKYFSDEPGPYYKGDWHHIEVYFKLNSIVNGKGVADGAAKYWYDGKLIINNDKVMLRTGQFPDMKFNQFLILPYIGDGSPIEQSFWVDDLVVRTNK
ncbi:MAG: hypothetical protein WCI43_00535 [Candidatus Firestonebacteria bacterium]